MEDNILLKALYFCIIDSIKKHNDMNMVWEAIPKNRDRNREIIRNIVTTVLAKSKENIKEDLLVHVTKTFNTNIFWGFPKDSENFLPLLANNIDLTLMRLKNAM